MRKSDRPGRKAALGIRGDMMKRFMELFKKGITNDPRLMKVKSKRRGKKKMKWKVIAPSIAIIAAVCMPGFADETIGFKGINLGMSYEDLDTVERETGWAYLGNLRKQGGDFLESEDESLARIGCQGEGADAECFGLKGVEVRYTDEKVSSITLLGEEYQANKIDPYVKNWVRFCLDGLKKKYGPPEKTFLQVDGLTLFAFKENYLTRVAQWRVGKTTISLSIRANEFQYSGAVEYETDQAVKKRRAPKAQVKSEL